MFPYRAIVSAFHIVQLIWTANHQSYYDCIAHNVHENAAVILYVFFL